MDRFAKVVGENGGEVDDGELEKNAMELIYGSLPAALRGDRGGAV